MGLASIEDLTSSTRFCCSLGEAHVSRVPHLVAEGRRDHHLSGNVPSQFQSNRVHVHSVLSVFTSLKGNYAAVLMVISLCLRYTSPMYHIFQLLLSSFCDAVCLYKGA